MFIKYLQILVPYRRSLPPLLPCVCTTFSIHILRTPRGIAWHDVIGDTFSWGNFKCLPIPNDVCIHLCTLGYCMVLCNTAVLISRKTLLQYESQNIIYSKSHVGAIFFQSLILQVYQYIILLCRWSLRNLHVLNYQEISLQYIQTKL